MKCTLGILLIATLLGGPAVAQTTDHADVRTFIERNAELLDQAGALVRETNSTKARGLLDTATSLHKQSVALLDQNAPAMAGRVALRAREAIQQTIAVAKREARTEEQANKVMEVAGARLEQARTAFEETGRDDASARRLILESSENLRRAREQMHQHMFETSLRLAEASLSLSNRAIRLLRQGPAASDPLVELERTQRILDRLAETRRDMPPDAARLTEQAHEMQARAMRNAEKDNVPLALEQTRGARSLALRALRATGPPDELAPDNALRALALTDEILDGARAVAGESNDEGLSRHIEEAFRQQDHARRALDSSDVQRALQLTMNARETARSALRAVSGPVDPGAAEAALARTDEAISRLRDALQEGDDPDARDFLTRAGERQREARQALAEGDPRRALALTKVAFKLARTGLDRVGDARG